MRVLGEKFARLWEPRFCLVLFIVTFIVLGAKQPSSVAIAATNTNNSSSSPVLAIVSKPTPKPKVLALKILPKRPVPRPIKLITKPVDCSLAPCLALTFDDGPNPATTPIILDALTKEQVKATFFVIGNKIAGNIEIVRRIYLSGNEIGNHSWSHPDFTKLTAQQIHEQIDQTQTAIASLGIPAPKLFRPPYEARNQKVEASITLPIILWDVDPKDWHETDPNKIAAIVEAEVKPGAIIVMHDAKPATAAAVGMILKDLKQHYALVTVSELLNLPLNAQGEFFSR